jgi:peptidoglycan/LPS O-acetylase OafA/YrhL
VQIEHGSRLSAALDGVRALAAFAVFAGHTRGVWFVEHGELASAGPLEHGFYLATGLGHQAVLVFFVLSGLFIAQAIRARTERGSWSWPAYAVDRLSRLWIVVLPALVLTALCDALGARLAPDVYSGAHPSNVIGAASERLGLDTLIGNALFVQTIAVDTFGSNGALWSLANEFWYYLLFPLALRAATARGTAERATCAALAIGGAWFVGGPILTYFPAWLLGAALAWRSVPRLGVREARAALVATGAAFGAALLFARLRHGLVGDYAVALSFTALVASLATFPTANLPATSRAARAATLVASSSFTLYAIHLPLVVLARALLGAPADGAWRFAPTPANLGLFALALAAGLVVAHLVARATEAHTGALRGRMRRLVVRERRPVAA